MEREFKCIKELKATSPSKVNVDVPEGSFWSLYKCKPEYGIYLEGGRLGLIEVDAEILKEDFEEI